MRYSVPCSRALRSRSMGPPSLRELSLPGVEIQPGERGFATERWLAAAARGSSAPSRPQTLEDELTHATLGRQNPEEGEGTGVENFLAVDEDRELAVVSFDGRHLDVERTSQISRHPGSLDARHSVAAAADDDGHLYPRSRSQPTAHSPAGSLLMNSWMGTHAAAGAACSSRWGPDTRRTTTFGATRIIAATLASDTSRSSTPRR